MRKYEFEIWMSGCFGTEYTSMEEETEKYIELDVNDVLLDVVYAESLDAAYQMAVERYGEEAAENLYVLEHCVSARTKDGRNVRLKLWTEDNFVGYAWSVCPSKVDKTFEGFLLEGHKTPQEEVESLSPRALELAYRQQQLVYRIEDAKVHFRDLCDNGSLERFGIFPEDDTFEESDAAVIAERFLDIHDCNIAENDQFDALIEAYCEDENIPVRIASYEHQLSDGDQRWVDSVRYYQRSDGSCFKVVTSGKDGNIARKETSIYTMFSDLKDQRKYSGADQTLTEFEPILEASYVYEHNDGDQCWDDHTCYVLMYNDTWVKEEFCGWDGSSTRAIVSKADILADLKRVKAEIANRKRRHSHINRRYGYADLVVEEVLKEVDE